MKTNETQSTKVVTGVVRLSYAHVWEPHAIEAGEEPKYSVSLIVKKSDTQTVKSIKRAIDAAIEAGAAKLAIKAGKPANKALLKLPLRDGDEDRPENAEYADSYFLNASRKSPPEIVDRNCDPIIDKYEVYSGCYARVSLNFYAFNRNGNKGIACGLGNIQKIKDGEPLDGSSSAKDDFGSLETVEDDDSLD